MSRLQDLSDGFKLQYEKFLHGCDALEMDEIWDVDKLGDMETYYFNHMVCFILRLISADGVFSQEETKYVNDMFGFTYSDEELAEIYRTEGKDIRKMLDDDLPEGYRRLKEINDELASCYKDMLFQACDIISESDGIVRKSELDMKELVQKKLA